MTRFFDTIFTGANRTTQSANFETAIYSYFSWGHIALIFIAFAILAGLAVLFFRKKEWETRVFIVCSVAVVAIFFGLITFALVTGQYMLEWFIPLHICSVMVLLMPIATIFKGKIRRFCYDYFVLAGIIGCVLGILFPMTSIPFYSPFHIVPMLIWALHVVLGALSVYLVVSGVYRKYRWLNFMMVLYVLLIPAVIVNKFLGTNFVFTNMARAEFPLVLFYNVFGSYTVLFVLALTTAVAYSGHLILRWFDKVKKKTLVSVLRYVRETLDLDEVKIQNFIKNSRFLKRFKNRDNYVNRLYNCIFTREVVEFLKESTIEQLLDYDHMMDSLRTLGVFERFQREFGIVRTLQLRHAVIK